MQEVMLERDAALLELECMSDKLTKVDKIVRLACEEQRVWDL